ncbi:MAG: aminotransferase class III-fold pyridoxal phosphate-dependent enzyme [Lawsonella sp.]|nr:aminotransferase class III-fold pyridoxal phosphate-dependent enzyme [Mycobacteriales bacterium]
MEIYDYPKNREAFARAVKVIPGGIYGHLGPTEGCHIPASAYPFYSERAEGAYIWDLDGNKFIDHLAAYGPMIQGYADEDINKAAFEANKLGDVVTLPGTLSIDLAELLAETVNIADWSLFAKNGADVTNLAMMTARAATGRNKIVMFKGCYHGTNMWHQHEGDPGVAPGDVENNIYVEWNNIQQLKDVINANKGEIAAIIAMPYNHTVFQDNELPAPGFWQQVRKLCDDNGIVLIIDDVRAGFRLDLAGSDHYFGFEADLICFCKALANGWNVSALCGKDSLKQACSSVMYTGSYWHTAAPFAAAIANIKKLHAHPDAPGHMRQIGEGIMEGMEKVGANHGFHLKATGEPSLFYLRIADDDSFKLHQEFIAECVKRGSLLASHHNHFTNLAETQEDVDKTIEIADEALSVVASRHPEMGFTA